MTKVILYIATSQDGFIADKNGGVDWLPTSRDEADEFGYKTLLRRISIILMGSRSYQQILGFGEWEWGDKTTYVFTSQSLTSKRSDIFFVHENIRIFMENLKKERPHEDVWLLGGVELIESFAQEKLIDECIITVVPKRLGEGMPVHLPYEDFTLTQTKFCGEGIIQRFYEKR
ncbi:MAG: hypothetical protein B7Y25_06510 [Alphaproteobacteria bacterium 16-39-46]|nr:MAG: hypothetical protein B7Y25_06510 [Alphaproteobacteria bacterium 16-39-46]OZA42290.1 MAG: hypothetical protein B7X84_06585 [Alphaproteobacteria bacterium 17-39-52]HQS84041.1 dihydrofolate reductase family protein [Alphaproteobacteria bacterium]HQS93904.1 dihydrofolate reductase family protein [Alphaproteobacteria bacterium]